MKTICFWIITALLSFMPALSGAQTKTLNAESKGRLEFQSFTPKTMLDLARERRENWAEVKVWGDLSFPRKAQGIVPAVVLSHSSGGVDNSMTQWVDALNDIGVAAFVVDSFSPRGVKHTVEDQNLVPPAANLMDAFQALNLLSTHPRIDVNRIGVMGFSRGGAVAFRAAVEPLLRAVVKSDVKFALHIPVYAACNQVYWSDKLTKAPLLNLVGAADDYTYAAPCEALTQKYAAAGTAVRSINYPKAHHAWDAMYPVMSLSNVTSAYQCGVVRWDIGAWEMTSEKTGEKIPADKLNAFLNACTTRGVHVGRNESAFMQSREDVQKFVREVFKLQR